MGNSDKRDAHDGELHGPSADPARSRVNQGLFLLLVAVAGLTCTNQLIRQLTDYLEPSR